MWPNVVKNSYGLRETPKWVEYDDRPVVLTWEQFCPQGTFLSCSASRRGTTVVVYGAEPRAAAAHPTVHRTALTTKSYLVQNASGATVETSWARLRYSRLILKCMRFFFCLKQGRGTLFGIWTTHKKDVLSLNNKNKTWFCPVSNNSECSIRGHCVDLQT